MFDLPQILDEESPASPLLQPFPITMGLSRCCMQGPSQCCALGQDWFSGTLSFLAECQPHPQNVTSLGTARMWSVGCLVACSRDCACP